MTYVEGNCCSNLDFIEEAISCSVVKFAIASCAAVIANSCIAALMNDVFTTDLALIARLYYGTAIVSTAAPNASGFRLSQDDTEPSRVMGVDGCR